MPNHVHLILCPGDEDGLRRALARAHRRYAGLIHARRRRTGHFWQGRYSAVAMDEDHLAAAYRYVTLNPGAGPARRARRRLADGRALRALLGLGDDRLTDVAPSAPALRAVRRPCRRATRTLRRRRGCAKARRVGRPVGFGHVFLTALETTTRRSLHALKRGPKPKDDGATGAAKYNALSL